MRERALAVVALAGLLTGGILWLAGAHGWADAAWAVGAAVVLVATSQPTIDLAGEEGAA